MERLGVGGVLEHWRGVVALVEHWSFMECWSVGALWSAGALEECWRVGALVERWEHWRVGGALACWCISGVSDG